MGSNVTGGQVKTIMTKRVKIILGSIFLVALVILALHLLVKEPELREVDFTREVSVRNNTEHKEYDDIVYAGLQILDIEGVFVTIRPMDHETKRRFGWENDSNLEAFLIHGERGYHQYVIYVEDMSPSKAIRVLAHELIHLKQVEEGKLSIREGNKVWWNGTRPLGIGDGQEYHSYEIPYEIRPWEKEAMLEDGPLASKIRTLLTLEAEDEGIRRDVE